MKEFSTVTIPERVIPAWEKKEITSWVCDKCGIKVDIDPNGYTPVGWIPINLQAGDDGEEGHQIIEAIFCGFEENNCASQILDSLIALGFSTHYHGSTNFLENPCVPDPWNNCPTRQKARYGNIYPQDEAEYEE